MKLTSVLRITALFLAGLLLLTSCRWRSEETDDTLPIQKESWIASITPTKIEHGVVDLDSQFILQLTEEKTKDELSKLLDVSAAFGVYDLDGAGKEWTLTPKQKLEPNKVLSIRGLSPSSLRVDTSFAFQTQTDLLVNTMYPYDEASGVSVDSAIEFTFNLPDIDISKHFEIEPKVKGEFIRRGYQSTFVPKKNLSEDTLYQITLKKGLSTEGGLSLPEDVRFQFTTQGSETSPEFQFLGEFSENYVEQDAIWLPFYYTEPMEGFSQNPLDMKVNVYRYQGFEQYSEAMKKHDKERTTPGASQHTLADTKGLENIAAYETTSLFNADDWQHYLILPENLSIGTYLVEITATIDNQEILAQKAVAINSQSVYVQLGNGDVLVWVNDIAAKAPAEGVEVSIEEAPRFADTPVEDLFAGSGITGADGLATLDLAAKRNFYLSLYAEGELVYFDSLATYSYDDEPIVEGSANVDYFTFLYTDREQYKATDTLRFWGTVLPRDKKEGTVPHALTASIDYGGDRGKKMTKPLELSVSNTGTFSGEIPFESLDTDSYMLNIQDEDGALALTKHFWVSDYETPTYYIDMTADKEFYHMGDPVELTLSATYYDGTPVVGKTLNLEAQHFVGPTQITLGESGNSIHGTLSHQDNGPVSWEPMTLYFGANNYQDMDDISISTYTDVTVLPSEVAGKLESKLEQGKATVQTAEIDMSQWNQPIISPRDSLFDTLAKDPVDLPVTLEIHKTTVTKTVEDEYYDAVNKKTITTYTYDYTDSLVETLKETTDAGKKTFEFTPYENTEEEFYWAVASYQGLDGLTIELRSDEPYFPSVDRQSSYDFFATDTSLQLGLGETLTFGLYENGEIPVTEGTVMYSLYQEDLEEVGFYGEEGYTFTMKEEHIPNLVATGAYFDGTYTHSIYNSSITYDYSDDTLMLTVASDKDSYKPGDNASLSLLLTDSSGNPVEAEAVVGVVDESVFADSPQSVDFMASLYQAIHYPDIRKLIGTDAMLGRVSKRNLTQSFQEEPMAMAESVEDAALVGGGLGGGTVTVRKTFADTALFKPVTIGPDGTGTIDFTLPDNITQWRITALAVTKDVQGGDQLSSAVTTLPFYINTAITPTYLEGDDVVIAVEGIGRGEVRGEPVEYTVDLKDANGRTVDTQAEVENAGNRLYVDLGKLSAGKYQVIVTGESGEYADALQREIVVVKQGLSVHHTLSVPAKDWDWDIAPLRYPVQMVAYDIQLKPYFDTLEWLAKSYGERTEIQYASYFAKMALAKYEDSSFSSTPVPPSNMDEFRYVYDQGFYALSQGDSDVATTAKVLAFAGDALRSDGVLSYLRNVLSDSSSNPHQRVMALLGLAVSEQPVLVALQDELKQNKNLSTTDTLYLAAGFAALGDYSNALELYTKVSGQVTVHDNGLYMKEETQTQSDEATAAALMALSYLHHPEASKFATYLMNQPKDLEQQVPYHGELMVFASQFEPAEISPDSSVTFTDKKGNRQTVPLEQQKNWVAILLNQKDFEDQSVEFSGDIGYLITYRDVVGNVAPTNNAFTVEKRIEPQLGSSLGVGHIAQVDFTITPSEDTPSGSYQVRDSIPSGMRYIQTPQHYNEENQLYVVQNELQEITLSFYYNKESSQQITGYYQVSMALPGEFVVEPGAVLSDDGSLFGTSEYGTVTIN